MKFIDYDELAHLPEYKQVRLCSVRSHYAKVELEKLLPNELIEWIEEKQHQIYVNKIFEPRSASSFQTYMLLLMPDDHLEYLLRWGLKH